MKDPVIKVSEISRLLVNLRKKYIKDYQVPHLTPISKMESLVMVSRYAGRMQAIEEVREVLELRRRSRENVILPKRK